MALFGKGRKKAAEVKRMMNELEIQNAMQALGQLSSRYRKAADEYDDMAKEALGRGEEKECETWLTMSRQCLAEAGDFKALRLNFKHFKLQSSLASTASKVFNGITAINSNINMGVNPRQMAEAFTEMQTNLETVGLLGRQMKNLLGRRNLQEGASLPEPETESVSKEIKEAVARRKSELLKELSIDTEAQGTSIVDERIQAGLDKIKQIRESDGR